MRRLTTTRELTRTRKLPSIVEFPTPSLRKSGPVSMGHYIHTINGHPAFFDGDVIRRAGFSGEPEPTVPTLSQLRNEQVASVVWRGREENADPESIEYGHIGVASPPPVLGQENLREMTRAVREPAPTR